MFHTRPKHVKVHALLRIIYPRRWRDRMSRWFVIDSRAKTPVLCKSPRVARVINYSLGRVRLWAARRERFAFPFCSARILEYTICRPRRRKRNQIFAANKAYSENKYLSDVPDPPSDFQKGKKMIFSLPKETQITNDISQICSMAFCDEPGLFGSILRSSKRGGKNETLIALVAVSRKNGRVINTDNCDMQRMRDSFAGMSRTRARVINEVQGWLIAWFRTLCR